MFKALVLSLFQQTYSPEDTSDHLEWYPAWAMWILVGATVLTILGLLGR